jgi:hemolysin activation/secretion protein
MKFPLFAARSALLSLLLIGSALPSLADEAPEDAAPAQAATPGAAAPRQPAPEEPTFSIDSFQLQGNTLFPSSTT